MSDEKCRALDGGKPCRRPVVALVTQTTRESKGQPAKQIAIYMCERHTKEIEATTTSKYTVTWL